MDRNDSGSMREGRGVPSCCHADVLTFAIWGKFNHKGFAKSLDNLPSSGNENQTAPNCDECYCFVFTWCLCSKVLKIRGAV